MRKPRPRVVLKGQWRDSKASLTGFEIIPLFLSFRPSISSCFESRGPGSAPSENHHQESGSWLGWEAPIWPDPGQVGMLASPCQEIVCSCLWCWDPTFPIFCPLPLPMNWKTWASRGDFDHRPTNPAHTVFNPLWSSAVSVLEKRESCRPDLSLRGFFDYSLIGKPPADKPQSHLLRVTVTQYFSKRSAVEMSLIGNVFRRSIWRIKRELNINLSLQNWRRSKEKLNRTSWMEKLFAKIGFFQWMWVCVLLYMWISRALELPIIKKRKEKKTVYEAKNNSDASHIKEVAEGRCTNFHQNKSMCLHFTDLEVVK